MNIWTEMSIAFANQKNYLDELYKVYPISPNLRRKLTPDLESAIETAFNNRDNELLIKNLLQLELFPIKDSYVASKENSIIMDCFAGSGTTLLAAARLGRKFIGIDSSEVSIDVIKNRLTKNKIVYSNSNAPVYS